MNDFSTIRVLLMEDDPGHRRLMQKRLEEEGYVVDCASSGEEGLAMYDKGSYDILIIDQTMPPLNGIDVVRMLTSRGQLKPWIMVTGTGSEHIAVEAMKLNVSDYVIKDVDGNYIELLPFVMAQTIKRQRIVKGKERVERELLDSEMRYRELFENMKSGVAIYEAVGDGEDFVFKDFNRGGETIDGVKREDLIGRRVTEAFPGVRELGLFDILQRVWRTGNAEHLSETLYSDGSGHEGWRENYVYKLPNREVVSIYDDITKRKKAEDRSEAYGEQLSLINRILRHDLTNDLMVIEGTINLYRDNPDDELLTKMYSRVKMGLALITSVRELGCFMLAHSGLRIYEIRDVIERVMVGYPSIDFNVTGKGRVMADSLFASVLDNIIGNAGLHGKADSIEIKIEKEGDMCSVRIADNGSGIPDKIKEKIFRKGFSWGKRGSTGMGLNIVKKIMKFYGGHVRVEDNEPRGAVIVLMLRYVRS